MSKITNAVLRRIGRLAVATGLVLLFAAVAGQTHAASGTVVIHEAFPSKNAAFWPNFVATSLGLYAKEGIEVQPIIVDPNVSVSTLIGGSAEISYADSTQLLPRRRQNMSSSTGCAYHRNAAFARVPIRGRGLTMEDAERKLARIVQVADDVWGTV